jgi:hypothetical protein
MLWGCCARISRRVRPATSRDHRAGGEADRDGARLRSERVRLLRREHLPEYGKLSHREVAAAIRGREPRRAGGEAPPGGLRGLEARRAGARSPVAKSLGDGLPGLAHRVLAMANKYLGATLDIHGGGVENMFPTTRMRSPSRRPPTVFPTSATGSSPAA